MGLQPAPRCLAAQSMPLQLNYGGRVTDDLDRRCLMSVLRKYITPQVLSEDYKFVPNSGVYYSPPPGSLEQYRQAALLHPTPICSLSARCCMRWQSQHCSCPDQHRRGSLLHPPALCVPLLVPCDGATCAWRAEPVCAPAGSTSSSCRRRRRLRCLECTPTPTSSSSCKRRASWWTACCPYSPAWT